MKILVFDAHRSWDYVIYRVNSTITDDVIPALIFTCQNTQKPKSTSARYRGGKMEKSQLIHLKVSTVSEGKRQQGPLYMLILDETNKTPT